MTPSSSWRLLFLEDTGVGRIKEEWPSFNIVKTGVFLLWDLLNILINPLFSFVSIIGWPNIATPLRFIILFLLLLFLLLLLLLLVLPLLLLALLCLEDLEGVEEATVDMEAGLSIKLWFILLLLEALWSWSADGEVVTKLRGLLPTFFNLLISSTEVV